ncbi:hypothetical protein AA983_06190 [Dermacoccus sp. PE3]|nr:hypothetical protein AA983_06190 [Dermacoccus sp. PE3]
MLRRRRARSLGRSGWDECSQLAGRATHKQNPHTGTRHLYRNYHLGRHTGPSGTQKSLHPDDPGCRDSSIRLAPPTWRPQRPCCVSSQASSLPSPPSCPS